MPVTAVAPSSSRRRTARFGTLVRRVGTAALFGGAAVGSLAAGEPAGQNPFETEPTRTATAQTFDAQPVPASPVPASSDWWAAAVRTPLRGDAAPLRLTLDEVLVRAVDHSAQIKVFAELPQIRRTAITEADAAFDWTAFVESRWDDISDPVGNTLTTGGAERFEDQQLSGGAGLRRRTRTGGRFEVSERLGYQDTNSRFFQPDPQATTRLTLSYTHPLLRGGGRCYNEALVVLARIDAGVAEQEFSRQVQSHLLEVARAYWGLYLERAGLAQKAKSVERAEEVLRKLRLRRTIDAVESQVIRAEAEVAARRGELVRAVSAVRNSEGRVRALVNDPALAGDAAELVPQDLPSEAVLEVDAEAARAVALQRRPEVAQALRQIKAAGVRLGMADHELLPVLNLITEGYVSGLRGNRDFNVAFADQFSTGRPSYSIGLQFEAPLGNRAACARRARRAMELRQLKNQYRVTVETLGLEVEVAVREVRTSGEELHARRESLRAAAASLDYVEQRWVRLPGENGAASLVLENLLAAQDRLADAEYALLQTLVTYNLSVINLKRATGELLEYERVAWGTANVNCLPTTLPHKDPGTVPYPVAAP